MELAQAKLVSGLGGWCVSCFEKGRDLVSKHRNALVLKEN